MSADKISQDLSNELIRIWNNFESDEDLYECTESGVEFNFMKCMEKRVVCLGTSIMVSFDSAEENYKKAIILNAFTIALREINDDAKSSPWFAYRENRNIHNAGLVTLTKIAENLLEQLD